MFGRCKVCEQKDLRIEELKAQIDFLKVMLQPSAMPTAVNIEANKILDGSSMPVIEVQSNIDLDQQRIELEREATRILTGDVLEIDG